MMLALHGISTWYTNLVTDIRIAQETSYDALEIWVPKLLRYLDQGYEARELLTDLDTLQVSCLNALTNIERLEPAEHKQLLEECERLSAAAETLGCPTIQLVSLCGLKGHPWSEIRNVTARNIAEIADIGERHDVRFQIEPIAWAPMHTLAQTLEVIDIVGRDNVGLVIDFFHLWAGGSTPDEVAKLDSSLIYGVHFCDALDRQGEEWSDMDRGVLPGDGLIPIAEWVAAVKATGYDGVWSGELFSPRHWEWDPWRVACEVKRRMLLYLD